MNLPRKRVKAANLADIEKELQFFICGPFCHSGLDKLDLLPRKLWGLGGNGFRRHKGSFQRSVPWVTIFSMSLSSSARFRTLRRLKNGSGAHTSHRLEVASGLLPHPMQRP